LGGPPLRISWRAPCFRAWRLALVLGGLGRLNCLAFRSREAAIGVLWLALILTFSPWECNAVLLSSIPFHS
jgi:hypothetical protein